MKVSCRTSLIMFAGSLIGGCSGGDTGGGETPLEAVLAHVGGLDRSYIVRSRPAEPESDWDELVGYTFPGIADSHDSAAFGSADVRFVRDVEYLAMFSGGCEEGWAEFHAKYPDAGALLGLSLTGRSDLGTRVAVYADVGSGCLAGMGVVFYLERIRGEWRVVDTKRVWVS